MKRLKNCIVLSSMIISSSAFKLSNNKFSIIKNFNRDINDQFIYNNNIKLYTSISIMYNNNNNIYERECITTEDIEELGKDIAKIIDIGDVLLLRGDLGAGKTTLTRGLLRELFQDDSMIVTSPSYLLDNTYEFNGINIHHMDLYRLPTASDLSMLGIPQIYDKSLCIIEWPERLHKNDYPSNYLDIELLINNNNQHRIINIKPIGENWKKKLKDYWAS